MMIEKLLKVEWLDARFYADWMSNIEIAELAPYKIENVGYGFVRDNGDVVMCTQKSYEGDGYKMCYIIPDAYITRIVELKEGLPLKDTEDIND